jgi:ABC-type branched-subunit amino acid transport system permease subunit
MSERSTTFLVLAFTVVFIVLYAMLSTSSWGRAMRALRDSETASQSIGLDPILIRTTAFALSAAAAGLAGGISASISNFISPESFPFFQSILFLLVVMIGGAEHVLGPLAGAIIVAMLPSAVVPAQYRLSRRAAAAGVLLLAPVGLSGCLPVLFGKGGYLRRRRTARCFSVAASRPSIRDLAVGGVRAAPISVRAPPARSRPDRAERAGKSTALV